MSKYAEKHQIAQLLGSPAGYVGHEEGGELTNGIKNGAQVILFDELEKAHQDIQKAILLVLLDKGTITTTRARN